LSRFCWRNFFDGRLFCGKTISLHDFRLPTLEVKIDADKKTDNDQIPHPSILKVYP
jgi:hypothetical protein